MLWRKATPLSHDEHLVSSAGLVPVRYEVLLPHLDERSRRLVLGADAQAVALRLGWTRRL